MKNPFARYKVKEQVRTQREPMIILSTLSVRSHKIRYKNSGQKKL